MRHNNTNKRTGDKFRREQFALPMLRRLLKIFGRATVDLVNVLVCAWLWSTTHTHCLFQAPCVVIDPYAGTNVVALAARELGCHFIGVDNDPRSKVCVSCGLLVFIFTVL